MHYWSAASIYTPSTNHPHANLPMVPPLPIQPSRWMRPNHADGGEDRHTRWAYQFLLTSNRDNRETGKRDSEIVQVLGSSGNTYPHSHTHNTCLHTHTPAQTRVHLLSLRHVRRSTHALPSPLHPDILKLKETNVIFLWNQLAPPCQGKKRGSYDRGKGKPG